MATQEKIVVEQIMDSVIKQSFELQRVSNLVGKNLAKDLDALAKELTNIASDFDFAQTLPPMKKKKMVAELVRRGNTAITKSHKLMNANVVNEVIKVGVLETNFAAGSINKAATGKGTILFASKQVALGRISQMAKNLIIRGAPQAEWWARQSVGLQNKFSDLIHDAWINNQSIPDVAQRIRGTASAGFKDGLMNVPKHQADSLARTSISSISNQVRQETYLANADVIKGAQFLAVLDGNTSDICRALSGDKWIMEAGGWRNIEGGHEYRNPPLHFNCRSTMIPLLKEPRELAKSKLALVPDKKKRSLGELIGPKVCHSPCKYQDPDLWLKAQPKTVQKDIMGKLYNSWLLNKISVKKVVTQKGRVRSTDELLRLVGIKDELVESIEDLKTLDNLKASPTAKGKFKTEVEKTTKAQFLGIERRLASGEAVSNAHKDKFGRLLINIDPADLEYKPGYHPKDLKDMLGTKDKRLAFYNHTAKKFERSKGWRKGDLSKRRTNALNDLDRAVLDQLKDKIRTDPKISSANKEILLSIYFESRKIVGTQRTLPMMESLFTLARKGDFSDIDNFLAYWNNSMGTSVNSYFARRKGFEIKLTANLDKDKRFSIVSVRAKEDIRGAMNRSDPLTTSRVSLKEASEAQRKVSRIGKRKLRNFTGEAPTAITTNLELSEGQSIEFFLRYLQKDLRLNSREAKAWMKRTKKEKFRTDEFVSVKQRKHLDKVSFITKSLEPGDAVLINDRILKSPLFKEWREEVWSNRGFSPKLKKEVGEVLMDAQIRLDLEFYLKDKIRYPAGANQAEHLSKVIDEYIANPSSITNRLLAEKKVNDLYGLDGTARKKLRKKRAIAAKKRLEKEKVKAEKQFKIDEAERKKAEIYITKKDTAAKRRARKADKESKTAQIEAERDAIEESWQDMSDYKYIRDTMDSVDEVIVGNAYKPSSPFYKQANDLKGIDSVWLSKFINKEAMKVVQKGSPYTDAAIKLGEKFYYLKYGRLDVALEDSLKMGNLLLESLLRTKVVKRVKGTQLLEIDYMPPKEISVYQLEVVDLKWKEAVLANKTNYDIDGLPSVGRYNRIDPDGVYEDGTSAIRTKDKQLSADVTKRDSNKGWKKNLDNETQTTININGDVFDVMTELEKRGDGLIPSKVFAPGKQGVKDRTARESYDRARSIAKSVRDEDFYNTMTADKYGRTYADTAAIQWQGDDFNKGLMKFKRGVKLGNDGYEDFSRVFANNAGFDKIPMASRVKLLDKIPDELILKTVDDPIHNDWWRTKKDWLKEGIIKDFKGIDKRDIPAIKQLAREIDPADEGAFQFLALLQERAAMIRHTRKGNSIKTFKSHLSMPSDGTTNVLQHMGAISRDAKTAKLVNMTKTREVKDAYIAIRLKMDKVGKGLDINDPLKIFIDLPDYTPHGLRRKSVKHGLMTAQYNAGAATLGDQYFKAATKGFKKLAKTETDPIKRAEYERLYDAFRKASKGQKTAVGRYVAKAVDEEFPAGLKVRNTLNKFAEAHEIAGKDINLKIAGTDFPFRQSYKKFEIKQVELPTIDGKSIKVNVKVELDALDFQQQRIAFAPNFIHAMDAAHKSLTVNILHTKYGVRDFSMIHDSFGVHAGYGKLLNKATKEAFEILYRDKNVLRDLYYTFKRQGIDMNYFIRNGKGQKKPVVDIYKTRGEVPLYLRDYYRRDNKGRWVYKGKKHYDEDKDKWFPITEISLQDLEKLGDYNFDDLADSQYFFH